MSRFLLNQKKYNVMSDNYSKTIKIKKNFNKFKLDGITFSKNDNIFAFFDVNNKILNLDNKKNLILNYDKIKNVNVDGIRFEFNNPYELYKLTGYIWRGEFNQKKIHLVLIHNNNKFFFSSKIKSDKSSKSLYLYQTNQNVKSNLIFSIEKIKKNTFNLEIENKINKLDVNNEIFTLIIISLLFSKF